MAANVDEANSVDRVVDFPDANLDLIPSGRSGAQPDEGPMGSIPNDDNTRSDNLTDAESGSLPKGGACIKLSETEPITEGSVGSLLPTAGSLLPVSVGENSAKETEKSSFSCLSINTINTNNKSQENDDAAALVVPPAPGQGLPTSQKIPARGRPRLHQDLPDPLPGQTDAGLAFWLQKMRLRCKGNLAKAIRSYAFRLYRSHPNSTEGLEPVVYSDLYEKFYGALTERQKMVLEKAKYFGAAGRRLEQREEYAAKIMSDENRKVREYQHEPSAERRKQQLRDAQTRRRAKKRAEKLT